MSVFLDSSVAFQLGAYEVKWYGVIIAAAVVLAIYLATRIARYRGLTVDNIIDFALIAVPLGVVCARLYYIAFSWAEFVDGPDFPLSLIQIQKGGIAIYGAVIGGVLAAFIYSKFKKINILALLDIAAPVVVLAQCVGRWGNFANQEAFGRPVYDTAMQWFPYAVFIDAEQGWFQATFFYESLWCLLVFGILMWFFFGKGPAGKLNRSWAIKRGFETGEAANRALPKGNIAFMYFALYGLGRAFIEPLRSDSLYVGNLRASFWLSLILLVGSAAAIYANYRYGRPAQELSGDLVTVTKVKKASENFPIINGDYEDDDQPEAEDAPLLVNDEENLDA